MRRYPLPSADWMARNPISAKRPPDELLGVFDILQDDRKFERIFHNVDDYYVDSIPKDLLNDSFAVAFAYLLLCWNTLLDPLDALEDLVVDFRGAETIWSGDGGLPAKVAGIGAMHEGPEQAPAELSARFRGLVENYVRSLTKEGWIAENAELGLPRTS